MTDPVELEFYADRFTTDLVRERLAPRLAVRRLFQDYLLTSAEDLCFAMTMTAGRLEDMRVAQSLGVWTDWQRVDYWLNIARSDEERRQYQPTLSEVLGELYQAVTLVNADLYVLRQERSDTIRAGQVIALWDALEDPFF